MNEQLSATVVSEQEQPVIKSKRKRSIKEGDKRLKENREPTEAQKQNQFKKGTTPNPGGRPKTPEGLRAHRLNCEQILLKAGLPTLVNHLYRTDLTTRDLLEIVKYLTYTAYGKPKEVNYQEADNVTPSQFISPIIINQDVLNMAMANDAKHFDEDQDEE